jgi:IS6 family transposase
VITLDENPAYPPAIQELIDDKALPKEILIRQTKYQNNIVGQDHRFIKKITYVRKWQAENNSSVLSTVEWLNKIFGIVA